MKSEKQNGPDISGWRERIGERSEALYPCVSEIYRRLHRQPELSFREERTAAFICERLAAAGVPFRAGIGGHGVVARIVGRRAAGKVVGLRADMDALPIREETGLPFASACDGVMHACGHDAHVACLLGAVRLLQELRESFDGTVLAVFQPGEERHPGGARLMLENGVFDGLRPDLMIAQHVNLDVPSGEVALSPGAVMASADEFHLEIFGTGGHGALPHRLNDTVLAAAQTVVSLQQVVSRLSDPFHPAVLTVGRFIAEGATNVIPHSVFLSGTLRCMDAAERVRFHREIARIVESTAAAYGCGCKIDLKDGYPPVVNDERLSRTASAYLSDYLGAAAVHPMERRMTSEDFGFFAAEIPSVFYRLGARGASNRTCGDQHTSTFRIDEPALRTGVAGLAWLALRFLWEDAGR